jgi:hypothetical protein
MAWGTVHNTAVTEMLNDIATNFDWRGGKAEKPSFGHFAHIKGHTFIFFEFLRHFPTFGHLSRVFGPFSNFWAPFPSFRSPLQF